MNMWGNKNHQADVQADSKPSKESTSEERNWMADYKKRMELLEQFMWQETVLKERVDSLTNIHKKSREILSAASKDNDTAKEKIEHVKRELQSAEVNAETAYKNYKIASETFKQTVETHDIVCSQLEIAQRFLHWHESQGESIRQSIPLPPLGTGDTLGQSAPPSIVCDVTLLECVAERITLKALSPKNRWEIILKDAGKSWEIIDNHNRKPIILIRRVDDKKIQIEWKLDMKKEKFDPSVNDVRFSVLVIEQTVNVAEHTITRKQYRSLFDTTPDTIKKFIEE